VGAMEKAFKESQKLDEMLGFTKTNNSKEETQMTKTVRFEQNNEVAVVREENGTITVERGGAVTPFRSQFTLEQIADQFIDNGWIEVLDVSPSPTLPNTFEGLPVGQVHTMGGPTAPNVFSGNHHAEAPVQGEMTVKGAFTGGVDPAVANSALVQNITIGAQKQIDEYLELHKQKAELEKQMNGLKTQIRDYMDTNDLKGVKGTNGQQIVLQDAKASNSTSRYTDYDLKDVMSSLDGTLLKQVTEIRVNADKLEALLKVEKLPASKVKEIKGLKIVNPGTPRFTVKK
jgi:hypothetical protein